ILSAVGIFILVFGGDWAVARSRLDNIVIEIQVEPESVIANGKNSSTLTIRITEGGQPRVNDLVQLWLSKGGGLLTPNWVYTDADGSVIVTYTPNPYSRYDPQNGAEIAVLDTSIGRLIEVGKQSSVLIPLIQPDE
ncbi:MAG: hypothetical protein IT319_00850, partial [Anaerolineae bacterium]|nr:hypothetical protein [Anaerolineae bacterium]